MNAIGTPRSFGLDNRMTVVLFAGMGGGCDGLEAAGFHVHLAVNHDPLAIAVHEKRHPHTRHLRCDVFEVDPRAATQGRGVRVLHASPDCTHFSVAKGSKPVSKRRRSLAWVVPRWCGTVRPEVVTLENVREIETWGPLIAKRDPKTGRVMRLDGSVAAKGERVPVGEQWLIPDPRHKGRIWKAWLKHMADLGYSFEGRVLVCADYGIPTIRKRFFGVARADGGPIAWPERTHAPRDKARALKLKPWVGAHTIIDWSLPMKSIFGRDKELADATKRRIARGLVQRVVEADDPYLVPASFIFDTAHAKGQVIAGDHGSALVAATMIQTGYGERVGQAPRVKSVEEPTGTQVAGGSKEALVAAFLAKHYTGVVGADVRQPMPALTTGGDRGVTQIAPVIASLRGTAKSGRDARDPLPAQSAGGNHEMLILPFLQTYYGSGENNHDIRDPLHTVTVNDRHGLVTVEVDGQTMVITDILMRMLDWSEGARAHGFDPESLMHEIEVTDAKGRTVRRRPNKTECGHLVGNSVPPKMVQLLAESNVRRELMVAAE